MGKLTTWEKLSFFLLAGFLLFCAGIYAGRLAAGKPMQVTVQHQLAASPAPEEGAENPGGTPASLLEGERININAVPEKELQRLPGIGEKRAQAIVARRETVGPFQAVEELLEIEGIGPAILEGLRDYVALENAPQ